jgi:hypothetical protein
MQESDLADFFNSKWVRRLGLWVLAPMALIYGWFQYNYPTCTFRYKLTAEVMTPDGLKTGSSVIEVSYRSFYSLSGYPSLKLTAIGEAVQIPLDGKRLFVATLMGTNRNGKQFGLYDDKPEYMKSGLDLHALPLKALGVHWTGYDEWALAKKIEDIRQLKRKHAVPFQNLPLLVVFNDIANPDSVVVAEPNGLDKTLGAGFALQNVWLELTYDAPTDMGMRIFPWWDEKMNEQKTLGTFGQGQSLINNILDSAFRRPGIWDNNQ